MKMRDCLRAGLVACALAGLSCGCNRGPSLSEIEAKERTSRLYRDAVDDLQAGRMDAAIKRFERVVQEEPKSYSAHFQLATLLQDVRKDYISAIAHYRDYLAMRPASDKATVAQDRVKLCEALLSAEMVRKAGGSATNRLSADNEKLAAERDELTKKVAKLEGELAKSRQTIATLEADNASKSRMLQKLQDALDLSGGAKSSALKSALAELKQTEKDAAAEVERRRLRPTDAELLDDEDVSEVQERKASVAADLKQAKADLAKLDAGVPPPPPSSAKPVAGADAKTQPAAAKAAKPGAFDALVGGKKPKSSAGAAGGRPETYTVQDGDTLFKISTKFYGSSHKWRDIQNANRAILPANGRVRAGQVLKLP